MKGIFFPYKDDNVSRSRPVITYALIGLNIIIFIISLFDFENIITTYGFKPSEFVLTTLITSMFLHGGPGHILGNMWYLFMFGDNVEDKLGKEKYILFYLVAGIAATLAHYAMNIGSAIPTIGASGAISGVLGAYLVWFPHARIHYVAYYMSGRTSAYVILGFWFLMQFLGILGSGGGIAFFAHIGGFIFGAAFAWIYKKLKKDSFNNEHARTTR